MLHKKAVIEILRKAARCWAGYEPVPGAKAYSDGSCRPKGSKKTQKEVVQGKKHTREKSAAQPGAPQLGQKPLYYGNYTGKHSKTRFDPVHARQHLNLADSTSDAEAFNKMMEAFRTNSFTPAQYEAFRSKYGGNPPAYRPAAAGGAVAATAAPAAPAVPPATPATPAKPAPQTVVNGTPSLNVPRADPPGIPPMPKPVSPAAIPNPANSYEQEYNDWHKTQMPPDAQTVATTATKSSSSDPQIAQLMLKLKSAANARGFNSRVAPELPEQPEISRPQLQVSRRSPPAFTPTPPTKLPRATLPLQ